MDTKGVGGVLALVVLGLFLGSFGFLPAYEHNVAVQEGEPTTAIVQSTDIDVREDDDGEKDYNPIVVYEYVVDGQTYTSENTYPGRFTRWGSRSSARDVVDRYESGDEVTIHYDPANPGNAYLRNDGLPGSWIFGLAYAVIAGAAGIWLIRQGFSRRKQRQLMADTPTEAVRSLSIGRSEIKGTAVTEDRDPMTAPFSDDDCVVAKYEIEEYDEDEDDDDSGSWKTVDDDVRYVPFYLDDGTGSVLVEPHDDATFDLDPDDWSETYVDSSDRGPEPIQEFVEAMDHLSFPSHSSGKDNDRKYRQNLIRTDESAYVFGTVHPRTDEGDAVSNADKLVVKREAGGTMETSPMYMISDDSEKSLTNRRRWALWRAPAGCGFMAVGLAFLLGTFGPSFGLTLPVLF